MQGSNAGTHADVFVGASLLALCGGAFWLTTRFPEVPVMLSQNVPPTFFPRVVLAAIAVLSTALLVRGLRREPEPRERIRPAVLATAALLIGAVALVPYLGMLGTLALFAIVLPVSWGERRPFAIVSLAIGLPLAIHLLFAVALDVRFPLGLLW